MPQTLVKTRLHAPRTRPNLVERPRLHKILDRGEGRKLTLVSAPAGFGKTTLLVEWLVERSGNGRSGVWLSLDGSDNDPARFLSYLLGALQNVMEGIGEGVLALLRVPELPLLETLVGALINELAASGREVTVFLDDYHLIDARPVHAAVSFFLEQLPENVDLVIASRTDPPLPLSRLRVRDQVTEIKAADLRFTSEEAAAFLRDVMGLPLSAEDIAALEVATEGWAAALQLAALSMRDRRDASGFVESFSGSNRHVLDFLAEEVLERQTEDVREFLLRTSVLERMSAPLCDALIGRDDGQEMLERLEGENLFVVPLDDERRWYRYHHLFRDFLRGRLMRERSESASELHLRASGWYEKNGHLAEAIGHALSAPDHDLASQLIEESVEGAVERGEGATALRWLEALPTKAKRLRPRLFVEHAVALVITGRPDGAEPLLTEAERAASGTTDGEEGRFLLGFASAVRSWRARLRGDAPEAVELARRALSLLPDGEAPVRNYAAVRLGDALRAVGDLAAAGEAYAEAAETKRAARHTYARLAGMAMLASVRSEQGRLREADQAFRRALWLLTEVGFEPSPAAGVVHIGMANLLYERDELDGAEPALKRGAELAERTGDVGTLVWAYVSLTEQARAGGRGGSHRNSPPGGARCPRLRRRSADRHRFGLDDEVAPGPRGPRGSVDLRDGASRKHAHRRGCSAGCGPAILGEATPRPGSARRGAAAAGGAGRDGAGGGASGRPHRDPGFAGTGAVGGKQERAGREHPGRRPRAGGTGRLRPNLCRRGGSDGGPPLGDVGSSAERPPRRCGPDLGLIPRKASSGSCTRGLGAGCR